MNRFSAWADGITQAEIFQKNSPLQHFAALSVLLVGLSIAVAVCREVSRQSFAGEIVPYQFPILETSLFLLVLFGLEFLLSAWTAGRQRKQSLVEQMREMES